MSHIFAFLSVCVSGVEASQSASGVRGSALLPSRRAALGLFTGGLHEVEILRYVRTVCTYTTYLQCVHLNCFFYDSIIVTYTDA